MGGRGARPHLQGGERGEYFAIDKDERGWVVCRLRPEGQEFRSVEPEQALSVN